MRQMTEDQFDEQCKPMRNHLNPDAGFTGTLFETFGPELDYVRSVDPRRVATLIDGDEGGGFIVSGPHLVNRVGYFVLEAPIADEFEVALEDFSALTAEA